MRALWPVLGGLVILGIVFVGLAENEPETITSSTEPTETIIIPKTFQAESHQSEINSKSFQSSAETQLLEKSNPSPNLIQTAEGIEADDNILSFTRYNINLEDFNAFDSSGNIFAGESNKVARLDVSTDTLTTWTLPNDQSVQSNGADVDSSGFLYFGMANTISKLDHNTNIFTEWQIDSSLADVAIDSSGNIYFSTNSPSSFLQKLNPSSNTVTKFFFPAELTGEFTNIQRIAFDSSNKIYFASFKFDDNEWRLIKFDPSTNALTVWALSEGVAQESIGLSPSGKIFFGENFSFRSKIAQLDPSTNVLKEWTIPFNMNVRLIAVDSSENVFFGGELTRFVPSTETFTQWENIGIRELLESTPDGDLNVGDNGIVGTVSTIIPPPPSSDVMIPPGSSVPGCEETNSCYIPFLTSVPVGTEVVWTNEDTAAHTVTSGTAADGPDGTFDSSLILGGNTFSHTFDSAGTFDYFCMVHPWMTGQVIVS